MIHRSGNNGELVPLGGGEPPNGSFIRKVFWGPRYEIEFNADPNHMWAVVIYNCGVWYYLINEVWYVGEKFTTYLIFDDINEELDAAVAKELHGM